MVTLLLFRFCFIVFTLFDCGLFYLLVGLALGLDSYFEVVCWVGVVCCFGVFGLVISFLCLAFTWMTFYC